MVRNYPVRKVSSAPSTGRLFYEFLMKNIKIPASATHNIWCAGMNDQLKSPNDSPFRGIIPTGQTLELISLFGRPFENATNYRFTGEESFVLVSDLSEKSREQLGIPAKSRDKDKVYNINFKPYEDLQHLTKVSNELAALSVPKSISSYLAGVKSNVNYSERDVLNLLTVSFENLNSPEMMHILHGNHLAWAALSYIRENGNVEGDILAEFHGQNPSDFYTKDLGTILPAMFFALASLGKNPITFYKKLDVEIYGAKDSAEYMTKYMLV
ncbi:hypothetical protein J4440_01180 [Candidatus Woesearchaeota archaeon]|nr:hypothetical protein [Candidatus Woesearchaeota archaeon]